MVEAPGEKPTLEILTETQISRWPTPFEERKEIVVVYRATGYPPRVVRVPLDELPDIKFRQANPGVEVPHDLMVAGDLSRLKYAWEDLARIQTRRARPLSF